MLISKNYMSYFDTPHHVKMAGHTTALIDSVLGHWDEVADGAVGKV